MLETEIFLNVVLRPRVYPFLSRRAAVMTTSSRFDGKYKNADDRENERHKHVSPCTRSYARPIMPIVMIRTLRYAVRDTRALRGGTS